MSTTDALLVTARAIHFGAAIVLFGEMLFAAWLAPREVGSASLFSRWTAQSSAARFRRLAVVAWACLLLSGACWLVLVSMQMSARPLGAALDRTTIAAVLGTTVFGRAWLVRALLALALAALAPMLLATPNPKRRWAQVAAVIAGALLASLSWSGHANADVGPDGVIHHLSDSVHLLAAGAWLGGLAPLAALLRQTDAASDVHAFATCAATATRFGNAAALAVGAVVATGLVNAYYLLPGPSALVESSYGRLLLLKMCAFLAMLAVAAVNRTRLTPALHRNSASRGAPRAAAHAMRRNVFLEQALGVLVILLVAALGVSPPPMKM